VKHRLTKTYIYHSGAAYRLDVWRLSCNKANEQDDPHLQIGLPNTIPVS